MVDWKKILIPGLIVLLGVLLVFLQYRYQYLTFANDWSGRIYLLLCTGLISIGHGMVQNDVSSKIKHGVIMFILINVLLWACGMFTMANDALNGTTVTSESGIWIGFDTLTTPFTSKALEFKIIVQTLVGVIPATVLVLSLISVWTADSPDEQQGALIEFALVLAILIAFSFFGNLFGFDWLP